MIDKTFDWFILLVCVVFGVINLVAGFAMGQPIRIGLGICFVMQGPLIFVAFDQARKRRRR